MLPLQARVDLGVMAMKGCSAFPKAQETLEPHHHCLVSYPGHLLGKSYPSAERQSVYSTAPANWATWHLLGEVLSLCSDAVSVFYSASRLGHRTLVRGGLSLLQWCSLCILQPLLSQPTGPQDTRWENLTPLQRCSRCILQWQPIGPQDTR